MKNIFKKITSFAALMFLFSCGGEAEQQPQAMPVKVGAPIIQKLTELDEYTGRFRARQSVEIRSRVSGYLDKISFEDGQNVKAGDVLFVIDQRPYKIAMARAEAAYELANKQYARSQTLRKSNAVSQQEVDVRLQEFRGAKAAFDEAKLNLEFSEVKSPIDGRIGRNLVDVGNLVTGGDLNASMLTTVVSQSPIDFYFEASEQEALKYIRLNEDGSRESSRSQKRSVYLKLQDEAAFTHEGKVDFVDNAIDQSTGTLQARAVFDNPSDQFLPGAFGRIQLAGSGEYEAMLVPDDVIGTNQTMKFVYVVNKENTLEPRPVVLGPLHDNNMRIIRSGLAPNDQVVMAGITMLRPGMPVKPEPFTPGAAPVAEAPAKVEPAKAKPDKAEPVAEAKKPEAPKPSEVKKVEEKAFEKPVEKKPDSAQAPVVLAPPATKPASPVVDSKPSAVAAPKKTEPPKVAERPLPELLKEPTLADKPKLIEVPEFGLSESELKEKSVEQKQ